MTRPDSLFMLSFLLSLCKVWKREVFTFRCYRQPPYSLLKTAWSAPVHRGLAPADTRHLAWGPVRPKLTFTRTLTHPSHFDLSNGGKIRYRNVGNTAHPYPHVAETKGYHYQHHLIITGSYTLVPASKSGLTLYSLVFHYICSFVGGTVKPV